MKPLAIVIASICVACLAIHLTCDVCLAQAVVTRLPEEGTWASYKYKSEVSSSTGPQMTSEGEVEIRCLGSETIEKKPFRWIEIEQKGRYAVGQPHVIKWKMLLSEDALRKSKPLKSVRKIWKQTGDGEPICYVKGEDDFDQGLMGLERFFNITKPEDSTELDEANLELASGEKLECKVKEADYGNNGGTVGSCILTTYHSDSSPFGLARATWKSEQVPSGTKVIDWMVDDFQLIEIGTDAVSSMPDKK